MRVAEDLQALPERMEIGCRVLIDQTIQDDWCRIDKSTYCPEYRRRKDTVGLERYWEQNGVSGNDKEQWSRMRCGNVGRAGNKGYKDKQCRLCGQEDEELNHIRNCRKFKEIVNKELEEKINKLFGNKWTHGEWNWVLRGEVNPILCEYCRMYERAVKDTRQLIECEDD